MPYQPTLVDGNDELGHLDLRLCRQIMRGERRCPTQSVEAGLKRTKDHGTAMLACTVTERVQHLKEGLDSCITLVQMYPVSPDHGRSASNVFPNIVLRQKGFGSLEPYLMATRLWYLKKAVTTP